MALTRPSPFTEETHSVYLSSIGATPLAGYIRAPTRSKLVKVGVIQNAAVTGTTTVAVTINGTAVTGSSITVTAGSAGTSFTATPTAANQCVEDDVVAFTPSGGTGAAIFGTAYAVFRRN